MGTEFKIYDNGLNPKKCSMWDRIRSELGVILYVSFILYLLFLIIINKGIKYAEF